MKKILFASLAAGMFLLGPGGMAKALTIQSGATDVGGLDTILYYDHLANSGDQSEVDWVNGLLGTSYTKDNDYVKVDKPGTGWSSITFYQVDNSTNTFAYDLSRDGGYFLLKLGNITIDPKNNNITVPDYFLYRNDPSSKWAVFSLDGIRTSLTNYFASNNITGYSVDNFTIDKISHIGEFGSPVPEPATMLLFGTGIVGLVGAYRRKKK
jgi:hypothetical protein